MNGMMTMDGAHAMSMAWAPGTGESWLGSAATFVATWTAMMMVMMLPSVAPTLRRYHRALVRSGAARSGLLTALAVAAYLAVWTAVGAAIYPAELLAARVSASFSPRAIAIIVAVVVLLAGALQFTAWKARHLACCRAPGVVRGAASDGAVGAWRFGVRLGWHCLNSGAALTLVLLAVGMMDLRAMAAVTGAITAERLTPDGARAARIIGGVGVCGGLALLVHVAGR